MNSTNIPFNIYDFLSYIFQGSLLLLGIVFVFGPAKHAVEMLISLGGPYISSFILIILAYILGHINSELGSIFITNLYIKIIKCYSKTFEANKTFNNEFNEVFGNYFDNKFEDSKNKFLLSFHTVKENCPVAYSRISSFLVLYGFARNLCMIFIIYSALFLAMGLYYVNYNYFAYFAITLALSLIFFRRYYKFLHHHNSEVYYSFYLYARDETK